MDKSKCFLTLFVTCLILISFISCVNAETNNNETINDDNINIIDNETINDNVSIIKNENNNNEIIIPTVVNNTKNITVLAVQDKKHIINPTDDLNNYNTNSNSYSDSDSNNILIKNKNNDLIKVKLNDTNNNHRGDIAFGTVGLCHSVAILYLILCIFY